jgi:beta-glucosidase
MTTTTRADTTAGETPRYRDADAPISERVADLLERMTLDEKLAQLGSAWVFQVAGPTGLDTDRAATLLHDGIGHITRISGASMLDAVEAAELANEIQRYLRDETRLGIPAIVHEEICAGLMARQATTFPQAIGVSATFRPEHNAAIADAVRRQMRAMGAHQGLSPVLDICRDARWGRLEETFGEDPYLVTQMGLAFVSGLQSDDLADGVVATAKHLVGYGASEGGMNWAPAHLGERELRDVYLRPFEAVVRDAGLVSIMNAYHEIDGVPCAANHWLLTDVLRDEWGFDGTVVADYFSVKQLFEYHRVVASPMAAAATALNAGLDVELPGTDCYSDALASALDQGLVTQDAIDEAVRRLLVTKFGLGLFERPIVDASAVPSTTRTPEQIELAAEIARDSLVLLKNDGVLPLASSTGTVAVIGPNASNPRGMVGDYSYVVHIESLVEVLESGRNVFAMPIDDLDDRGGIDLGHIGTVVDELAARMPDTRVAYRHGCGVNGDDRSGFDDAIAAAAAADVAVMVMGERSGLTDDCTTGESRDVAELRLLGVQEELVHAVAATGTPVVLVLVAGRPIGTPAVHDAAAAVLMAWLPGECGPAAIADALVGDVSPGGKLPISYPRSSGQLPLFYSHKLSGGRSHWKGDYVDMSNEPLHPFGFGLSYSTFEIVGEPLDGRTVGVDDHVSVVATVTNTGGHAADEVVQVYSRDAVACITRPVRELQGFARVALDPGASARVTVEVPVAALGFSGPDMSYVVEPGEVEFLVGSSSDDLTSVGTVVIGGRALTPAVRTMSSRSTVEHR